MKEVVGIGLFSATVPTGTATIVLMDTFQQLKGQGVEMLGLERYKLRGAHDQAFTLRLSSSSDGSTWFPFYNQVIAIPSAPITADIADVLIVGPYVKAEAINGGTNQTLWNLQQVLTERGAAPA